MYKRRKVFSKIGEKTFSTTEFQTQKEFAAKKEESKKEKVAKAATIGGATVGLGAGAAGLGAEIGRKKVKKNIEKAEKELVTAGGGIKARKATSEAIDKLKKNEKKLEKIAKKAPKAALAGIGASVAAGTAYKLARKKNDQKEFAEKKDKEEGEKAKKAGKAMAGAGAALLAGSNVVGAKVGLKRGKAVEKIAEKTGTINIGGNGITAPANYVKFGEGAQEAVNKAAKLDERHLKKAEKVMKRANKVGAVGAGLAAAGAGTYLYGKHKAKKGEDQKKITDKEFSDGKPEQKEFNSAAQKLLRRASDYKKAMTGSGRLVSAGEASQINKGMNTFGNNGESFIKQGREMNKSLKTRKTDINAKINQKAGLTSAV